MARPTGAHVMTLIQLLVAASIVLSLWFVISLGDPRQSENPTVAWLLAAWGWATVVFESLLLLALLHLHVPAWLFAVVLLVQDGVFGWRIVLLYRSRRSVEK